MAQIMVVDDESDMRLALKNVLSAAGHDVEEAADGPTALARVEKGGLDAVLLDMRLPGMDGKEILRRLRALNASLPVIMVTGYGDVDSAVDVVKLGASHYIAKPFSNKELTDALDSVLAKSPPREEGPLRRRLIEKVSERPAPAAAQASGRSATATPQRPASAPPAGPAAERGSRRWLGWGVAAACAGAALFWFRPQPADSFALPYAHPVALQWVGDRLWTADWFTQTVYEHRINAGRLELLRSVKLANTNITGIAVVHDKIFIADSFKKQIQRRRIDAGLSLIDARPSPGPSPSGLFWDGRYLWSSDSQSNKFYQHDPDSELSVLASFKSPGKSPAGMYKDSQYFWSADADMRMLYQHRLDHELRVIARYSLPAFDAGTQSLACFSWKDGALWLARDGLGRLWKRPLSAFRRIPG